MSLARPAEVLDVGGLGWADAPSEGAPVISSHAVLVHVRTSAVKWCRIHRGGVLPF
jgi:hypothetical protein